MDIDAVRPAHVVGDQRVVDAHRDTGAKDFILVGFGKEVFTKVAGLVGMENDSAVGLYNSKLKSLR